MFNQITEDLLDICGVLNKNEVQYLIVGGLAVGFHGFTRLSTNSSGEFTEKQDFDIWYNPTYNNYFRLLDSLQQLNQDVDDFKKEKTPNPTKSFFKFDCPNFTLDFLPEIIGLEKFSKSFEVKEIVLINDVSVPFLSYADLISNKKATGRKKDLEDIIHLETIRNRKL